MQHSLAIAAQAHTATAAHRLHVLFLNAQAGVGADIAVHLSLARTLDRSQVRVTAATSLGGVPGESAGEAFQAIPNIDVLPLELGQTLTGLRGIRLAMAGLDNVRASANLVSLAGWCRRNNVDVVHVTERPRQALFGLAVARLAGCAYLVHAHTAFYPDGNTRLASWRLRQADAVVGVSRFTASTFRAVGHLPLSRVYAVHNAVDGNAFQPEDNGLRRAAMRKRLGVPADVPLIGYVARLARFKDQAMLLDSFVRVREALPSARLILAGLSADTAPDGHGSYQDFLERRIRSLRLQQAVLLPGFVPRKDMPDFYAALDVVAHPALEEPFGLAIVEGMASARPVVASAAGGIPEIIRDGVDGLLVPPEQSEPMAAALLRVLRDPTLRARVAAAGRQRALGTFTPQRQAQAMLEVYRDVIASRRAR